jgi:hypothetical protein
MDDEPGFRASLDALKLENGMFQAVLTMSNGDDGLEPLVVRLAGEHETADDAKAASEAGHRRNGEGLAKSSG